MRKSVMTHNERKELIEKLDKATKLRMPEGYEDLAIILSPEMNAVLADNLWFYDRTAATLGLVRYKNRHEGSVIISCIRHPDGRSWMHLSLARTDRVPHWEELVRVKELFLGKESKAIAVVPPRSEYVNTHERCLHLWAEVEGKDGLPDFRFEGEI